MKADKLIFGELLRHINYELRAAMDDHPLDGCFLAHMKRIQEYQRVMLENNLGNGIDHETIVAVQLWLKKDEEHEQENPKV